MKKSPTSCSEYRTEKGVVAYPLEGLKSIKVKCYNSDEYKGGVKMHIPDNYLSPATCGVFAAIMAPVWYASVKKVKKEIPKEKIPFIGIGAAFAFLLMMFNVPVPGGTTAHAIGGTLIAILLGPYAACVAVSVALLIQAVVFGDGGILAYGANCFNMAFVLPFTGYYIYVLLRHKWNEKAAILIGSYIGINIAAFCAAVEFGVQPLLYSDAAGHALYCPYPLWVSIPAMCLPHLLVIGFVEAFFTLAIYSFIAQTSPGLVQDSGKVSLNPIFGFIIALILLSPLGLLADGTAWGEWGADEIAQESSFGSALGYVPAKLLHGFSYHAVCADYTIPGLSDVVGYIISGVIGAALLIIIFKIAGSLSQKGSNRTA